MWATTVPDRRRLLNAAGLLLATLFVLSYFDLSLVLSDTAITGGDTLSQLGLAMFARDSLFARFQFSGWDFGNLAGYPALHYYFPLPFILSAALSAVMPLTVALKIVTLLCAVLLPCGVYYLLRQMRFAFPTPILGAALTLPFLFMESQSMWGGNLLSMLAGEFSYSLGIQLALLYFASYWRGSAHGTRVLLNAALLALVALSHGCALLVAGFVPLFHVFTGQDWRRDAVYYLKVNIGAFCLVSPWLLGWAAYNRYTSGASLQWAFNSMTELFPFILAPTYILGACGLAMTAWTLRYRTRVDRRLLYPWFGVLVSLVLFRASPYLGVADIRFIPFMQLFVGLAAAILLGSLLRRLRGQTEMAACLVLACVVWAGSHTTLVHAWAKWNYEGVERKAPWPTLRDLSAHLKGSFEDPRVVYENSGTYDAFGTPRIFEMLPYFAGRATLEGAHLQGSLNSPFAFYLQSQVSEAASCPFPNYRCSGVDLRAALPRMDLYNVGTLLVRSDRVKQEAQVTHGLSLDRSFGPIDVYTVTATTPGYVQPLACAPVLYTGAAWKPASYEWFVKYQPDARFVAFAQPPGREDSARFARITDQFPVAERCQPQPPDCSATSQLGHNQIRIRTDCIAKPLLVKTSYHPRWRVRGAARIYAVTPGFMLLFPTGPDVELTYGWGAANYAGAILAAGFLLCAGLPNRFRFQIDRFLPPRRLGARRRSRRSVVLFSAAVAVACVALLLSGRSASNVVFAQGLAAFQAEDFARAKVLFKSAADADPRSSSGVQSLLYLGYSHYRTERWTDASNVFRALAEEFPENPAAPEALYHLGMSAQRAGQPQFDYFWRILREYPRTPWARHARERLTEAGQFAAAVTP